MSVDPHVLAHSSLLSLFVSSAIASIKLLIVIPLFFPFRWFWEVVEDRLDEESRARLLQFTTGGCNVPAQGFKVRIEGGREGGECEKRRQRQM